MIGKQDSVMMSGVVRVSESRWLAAQQWEEQVWKEVDSRPVPLRSRIKRALMEAGLLKPGLYDYGNDWNVWWSQQFDRYAVLPRRVSEAVEIGCGPFTNLRVVQRYVSIRRMTACDPLADSYLRMRNNWLSFAHRKGQISVHVAGGEELPLEDDRFDLAVLINVLDHVRDATQVLASMLRVVRPAGFIVVGQEVADSADLAKGDVDTGHPIHPTEPFLAASLEEHCRPLFRKTLSREQGRVPGAHAGTYLLIGQLGKSSGVSSRR
jgi:SAM-dependent methyltransferase